MMIRHLLVIVLLVSLALPLAAQEEPGYLGADDSYPQWSPDSQQILFKSTRDGFLGLYVMDANGRDMRGIINDNDIISVWWQTWLPNSQQVVFVGNKANTDGVYLVDIDNNLPPQVIVELESDIRMMQLAPNGRELLYAVHRDNQYHWFIASINGDNQSQLEFDEFSEMAAVIWSPDGRYLAFYDSNGQADSAGYSLMQITIFDLETNTVQYPLDLLPEGGALRCCSGLNWSPDSANLVIATYSSPTIYTYSLAGRELIAIEDVVTGTQRFIWLNNDEFIYTVRAAEDDEAPIPEERRGTFMSSLSDPNPKRIAALADYAYFSPDARRYMVYQWFTEPSLDLYDWVEDTHVEIPLAYYNVFGLDWSPDGRYAVTSVCINDDADIYRIDAQTGEFELLTYDDALADFPEERYPRLQCHVYG